MNESFPKNPLIRCQEESRRAHLLSRPSREGTTARVHVANTGKTQVELHQHGTTWDGIQLAMNTQY